MSRLNGRKKRDKKRKIRPDCGVCADKECRQGAECAAEPQPTPKSAKISIVEKADSEDEFES